MDTTRNRVIVTGGTKSDVAAIAVLAMNIQKTNGRLFSKLIVFHDGIRKKDKRLINTIMKTEFIYYKLPFRVKNDVVINYFSPMLFCKYECLRLLNEYEEVVWSDYDVVFQDSIDEFCIHADRVGMNIVVDKEKKIREMFYSEIRNPDIKSYNLEKEALCTPLFSVSRDIGNYMELYRWCYDKTEQYEEDLELPEQCIISLMVQEFNIIYKGFDPKVYACHPRDSVGKEKILHAYEQPKFWNGLRNADWDKLYSEWVKMGGTRYDDLKKEAFAKLRLIYSRIRGIRSR